jgi:hypothetical protein
MRLLRGALAAHHRDPGGAVIAVCPRCPRCQPYIWHTITVGLGRFKGMALCLACLQAILLMEVAQ